MSRETVYQQQMESLGIWDDAFKPAVHVLAMQERELQRTQKALSKYRSEHPGECAESTALYALIMAQRKEILVRQDALGLTPKGLTKLRGKQPAAVEAPPQQGASAPMTGLLNMLAASVDATPPGSSSNG